MKLNEDLSTLILFLSKRNLLEFMKKISNFFDITTSVLLLNPVRDTHTHFFILEIFFKLVVKLDFHQNTTL